MAPKCKLHGGKTPRKRKRPATNREKDLTFYARAATRDDVVWLGDLQKALRPWIDGWHVREYVPLTTRDMRDAYYDATADWDFRDYE